MYISGGGVMINVYIRGRCHDKCMISGGGVMINVYIRGRCHDEMYISGEVS